MQKNTENDNTSIRGCLIVVLVVVCSIAGCVGYVGWSREAKWINLERDFNQNIEIFEQFVESQDINEWKVLRRSELPETLESMDPSEVELLNVLFNDLEFTLIRVGHGDVIFFRGHDILDDIGIIYTTDANSFYAPKEKLHKQLDEAGFWYLYSEHPL